MSDDSEPSTSRLLFQPEPDNFWSRFEDLKLKSSRSYLRTYDPNEPLHEFLLRDSGGLMILSTFSKQGSLANWMETLLVRKVIARELDIALQRANITLGEEQLDKFD